MSNRVANYRSIFPLPESVDIDLPYLPLDEPHEISLKDISEAFGCFTGAIK
jgi:hypothetical protein